MRSRKAVQSATDVVRPSRSAAAASDALPRKDLRDLHELVFDQGGRIGEHFLAWERLGRHVVAEHVGAGDGVRGGLDAGDVEFGEHFDIADDLLHFGLQTRDHVLRQAQARQRGDLGHVDFGSLFGHGECLSVRLDYWCSSLIVSVLASQTTDGPKYWIGPG